MNLSCLINDHDQVEGEATTGPDILYFFGQAIVGQAKFIFIREVRES